MKPMTYRLTVFEPSSVFEPMVSFKASSPFLAFDHGCLINPSLWPKLADRPDLRDKLLKVVGLEHGIEEFDDQILHVLDLFTETVANSEGARRSFFVP